MESYFDLLAVAADEGLTVSLQHFLIVELWTNGRDAEERSKRETQIEKAILTGRLIGVPKARDPEYPTGFKRVPVDDWHNIRDGRIGRSYVSYDITRDDFKDWLMSRREWPLPETCLLSKWWITEDLQVTDRKREIQEEVEGTVRVASILQIEEGRRKAWEDEDYNGVLGLPPDWVPAPVIDQFKHCRNRMLDVWKYSPKEATEWIERYSRMGTENDDWFYPAIFPSGKELEADFFLEVVGRLAHIRWASSLEPEKGLAELAGDRASQGYAVHQASKKPRKDRLRELMEKTYLKLKEEIEHAPTNKEVLDNLVRFDAKDELHRTIDEIDYEGEKIFWRDRRDKEKTSTFATFYGSMTNIRKKSKDKI